MSLMDPISGALLSFGSSFLSGLFGKSGAKKRAEEEKRAIDQANKVNKSRADDMNKTVRNRAAAAAKVPIVTKSVSGLAHMTHDAIVNGYNPLTVLRAGGLAGYNTTTVTGSTAMDAALAGQHIATFQPLISQTQVPSTGEVLGGAIQAGVGTYSNMISTQQAQQFQMDLMQMQIAGANQNSMSNHLFSRNFMGPSAQIAGSVTQIGGGALRSNKTKAPSWWDVMDPGSWLDNVTFGDAFAIPGDKKDPQVALAKRNFMGMEIWHDPSTSDAQVVADRYGEGEMLETFVAVANSFADLIYNVRENPAFAGVKYSPPFLTASPSVGGGKLIVDYIRTGKWGAAGYKPGKGNLTPSSKGMKAFQ